MIRAFNSPNKQRGSAPLAIVMEREHGERYGLPYLCRTMNNGDRIKPGVLFDAEGNRHRISTGLLKKVALVEEPCLRISSRAYRFFGYKMNSTCTPHFLGEKTFQRKMMEGVVDQPETRYILLPIPGIPFSNRGFNSGKDWQFIMELPEFYAKANLGGGGACIFKIANLGGSYRVQASDGNEALEHIAKIFGKKPGAVSPDGLEIGLRGLSDMKRLFLKGITPFAHKAGDFMLIIESAIPVLQYDGRNVDFRFVLLKENGGFNCAAHYAKVGNGFVSNISKGGHGETTRSAITNMLSEAASKGKITLPAPIAEFAASLEGQMRQLSEKIGNKYVEGLRKANRSRRLVERLFGSHTPEHMINPVMLAPDFMLGIKDGKVVLYLVEINDGNIGISELESTDPQAHANVARRHTEKVVAEYEDAAGRFGKTG